jgi:hypothetical protein
MPGGKVVVGGTTMDYAESGQEPPRPGGFALARYNDDGSLDESFGDGGLVATRIQSHDNMGKTTGGGWVHDLRVLDDGRFLAAGTSALGNFTMARYEANGSLDASYGENGFATSGGVQYGRYHIAALADGNFAAAGASASDPKLSVTVVDAEGTVVSAASTPLDPMPYLSSGPVIGYGAAAFDDDGDLVATGLFAATKQPMGRTGDVEESIAETERWWDTVDLLVARFSTDVGSVVAPVVPAPPAGPPATRPPRPDPVPIDPAPTPGGDGEEVVVQRFSGKRTVRGGKFYQFRMKFGPSAGRRKAAHAPTAGIAAGLADRTVVVSGPNGFTAVAERIKVRTSRRGARAVAVYRFAAPGGTFDAVDDGNYTIRLGDAAVKDFAVDCPAAQG